MSATSAFSSPIPLSEMESVLAWVDTFKLSRPTKKINRDFSDAVLLAEILAVHYPKLVEMHNYPPRNSHALKLNNWMTLNRKVLKKLKLNLCCNTMELLANSAPGVVERVLVMVRDRIRRDEELNKTAKEGEQNVSSGGSYYEACGDDDQILVVPLKTRVNGVLETIQQKVVAHESYLVVKEELKDAKDTADLLKQKVDHLDSLIKVKDERIDELQRQLERKQSRRKLVEPDTIQNSLPVPFDLEPPTPTVEGPMAVLSKTMSMKTIGSMKSTKDGDIDINIMESLNYEESKIPTPSIKTMESVKSMKYEDRMPAPSIKTMESVKSMKHEDKFPNPSTKTTESRYDDKMPTPTSIKTMESIKSMKNEENILNQSIKTMESFKSLKHEEKIPTPSIKTMESVKSIKYEDKMPTPTSIRKMGSIKSMKFEDSKIPTPRQEIKRTTPKQSHPSITEVEMKDIDPRLEVDVIKSDVFKEAELINAIAVIEKNCELDHDVDDFEDSEQFKDIDTYSEPGLVTIEDTIQKEIKHIIMPKVASGQNMTYFSN